MSATWKPLKIFVSTHKCQANWMDNEQTYKNVLIGEPVVLEETYGGLGAHYLRTLYTNLNKIHQVDTVTGVTETNGSVRSRAIQVANEMRHMGLHENDIVLIYSRCHADQTVTVLACLLNGAIVAPMDPQLNHKECSFLVKQLKPKMCFCDLRPLKQIERVLAEAGLNSTLIHFGDNQNTVVSFRKLLVINKPIDLFKPIIIDNPKKHVAFILPTQGSTDIPKLVCISHHFVFNQTMIFQKALNSPEKIISYYPLSMVMQTILVCHCFEQPVMRVLVGPYSERSACKLIHDLKVDHAVLTTDLALQLVEHAAVRDFNLSCLKCVIIGNLITTIQDIKRVVARLPRIKWTQMYCTTETGSVTYCQPEDYAESLEKIGTVGKVAQNYTLRIVDLETRNDVDPENYGELLVSTEYVMMGYLKNKNLTKTVWQDGFYKTGDLAKCDGDGWLFIEGRITDMIFIDGQKQSPRQIENVILSHPFVKDAAVIGNEKRTIACVVVKNETKLDKDKLLRFMSQNLAESHLPNRIIFMDNFPTTSIGKVKKDLLREHYLTFKIEHSESMPFLPLKNKENKDNAEMEITGPVV